MSEVEFPSLAAFVCIMEKKKNKCAPGPNCLPCLVWKKVPIFAEALYKVFEMIFTKKQYPESWGLAYVSMLPKPNSDGKDITKARPIAVGNCDGKLYNSFLQEAIATHTLAKFPFQKGFLRGVPCIEHASITGEALKEAKMNKRNLVTKDEKTVIGDAQYQRDAVDEVVEEVDHSKLVRTLQNKRERIDQLFAKLKKDYENNKKLPVTQASETWDKQPPQQLRKKERNGPVGHGPQITIAGIALTVALLRVPLRALALYLTDLQYRNEGVYWDVQKREDGAFQRLFWTFLQPTSLDRLLPILCSDACSLTGPYGGCLYITVGVDAERHVVPLAYSVGNAEDKDGWCYHNTHLLEHYGGRLTRCVVFSDRQKGRQTLP